jgi:hypothetical protein
MAPQHYIAFITSSNYNLLPTHAVGSPFFVPCRSSYKKGELIWRRRREVKYALWRDLHVVTWGLQDGDGELAKWRGHKEGLCSSPESYPMYMIHTLLQMALTQLFWIQFYLYLNFLALPVFVHMENKIQELILLRLEISGNLLWIP